jgi:hypothetical protein
MILVLFFLNDGGIGLFVGGRVWDFLFVLINKRSLFLV